MSKTLVLKLFLIVTLVGLTQTTTTNAYFSDNESITNTTFTTGCWAAPSVPSLIYPTNGYIANISTPWYLNPYMDWSDSVGCPGKTITYQYESYLDSGLTNLAYRSGSLNNSRIDAPGTPNGTYYWRVRAYDSENWSDWSTVWVITVINGKPISPAFMELPPIVKEVQTDDVDNENLFPVVSEPEFPLTETIVETPLLTLESETTPELDIKIVSEDIPIPEEQPEITIVPEVINEVVPEIDSEPVQPINVETPIVQVEEEKQDIKIPPEIEPVNQIEEIVKPELNLEVLNNENN